MLTNAILIRENGRLRVYEWGEWEIQIWEGGSITLKRDDHFIRVDHNKSNMRTLAEFINGPSYGEFTTKPIYNFNTQWVELIGTPETFNIEVDGDDIILDIKGSDYPFSYNSKGKGFLASPKAKQCLSNFLKRRHRYEVIDFTGRMIFLQDVQIIGIENLFTRQEAAMLTVY